MSVAEIGNLEVAVVCGVCGARLGAVHVAVSVDVGRPRWGGVDLFFSVDQPWGSASVSAMASEHLAEGLEGHEDGFEVLAGEVEVVRTVASEPVRVVPRPGSVVVGTVSPS